MAKLRKYSESYLKMSFTSVIDNGNEKPQCVLCYAVLSNEAVKAEASLVKKHPEYVGKNLYFKTTKAG